MGVGFSAFISERVSQRVSRPVTLAGLCLILLTFSIPAQEASSEQKPNRLVTGKLVYVAPMPDGVDSWIQDNLRRWGKYTITANPEGVDLLIEGKVPEQETKLESHGGVAQPKGTGKRVPLPHRKQAQLPLLSITVVDWITGQKVWQADIINQRPKKDEPSSSSPGPQTEIRGRGLTADQIGTKVVAKLREYVAGLEKSASAPATPGTRPNKPN
jgi:hypothetical protein